MLNRFLEEVISITIGKQAKDIANILNSKKHVNEFIIAKKMDTTINHTRNMLYKVSDYGLVSYIRKKDKKKGWYTYFWKFEIAKSLSFLKNNLTKQVEQVNNKLNNRLNKEFYACKRCNIEMNIDTALNNDFICNECGDILTLKNNANEIKKLRRELSNLSKEIELLDIEIEKEKEKIEEQKLKEMKKIAKEKAKKKTIKKKTAKKKITKKKTTKKKITKKKITKKKIIKKKTAKKKITKKKTAKKKIRRK